jgi:hypothetical protein
MGVAEADNPALDPWSSQPSVRAAGAASAGVLLRKLVVNLPWLIMTDWSVIIKGLMGWAGHECFIFVIILVF